MCEMNEMNIQQHDPKQLAIAVVQYIQVVYDCIDAQSFPNSERYDAVQRTVARIANGRLRRHLEKKIGSSVFTVDIHFELKLAQVGRCVDGQLVRRSIPQGWVSTVSWPAHRITDDHEIICAGFKELLTRATDVMAEFERRLKIEYNGIGILDIEQAISNVPWTGLCDALGDLTLNEEDNADLVALFARMQSSSAGD